MAYLVSAGCGGQNTHVDANDGVGGSDPEAEVSQSDVTAPLDVLDAWLESEVDRETVAPDLTTVDPGTGEPDVWASCTPSCQPDDECGDDGCSGHCGVGDCPSDRECLYADGRFRCSLQCVDQDDCWLGAVCFFGACVDRECATDADCAPNQECWKGLRCVSALTCTSNANCPQHGDWAPGGYCDLDAGRCRKGNCFDDTDCVTGTCGADHWCLPDQCYGDPWGGDCPPSKPVCHVTVDRSCMNDPGCTTSACGLPCVRDSECDPTQVCEDNRCYTRNNDCQLDSQCPPGQYCHPGCVDPPPACSTAGECPAGYACSHGYCMQGADQNPTCTTDAECLAWIEEGECEHGVCQPRAECLFDADCASPLICASRLCLPRPDVIHCLSDADCPPDLVCQGGTLGDGCYAPAECSFSLQCGEGRVCGSDQRCYPASGMCAWVKPGPGFCDDHDPATVDDCDPEVGCTHVPQDP